MGGRQGVWLDGVVDAGKPTLCLYHDDPDGCCSAAIARRALGEEVVLHPLEIGDAMPWDRVEASDQVILVDYSLPLEAMRRLGSGRRLVWIDHHQSAIALLGEALAEVPGIRSTEAAACVLTWKTFYPDAAVPYAVTLIGDRDTWTMAYPETRAFSEGLYQEDFRPTHDDLWKPLLDGERKRVEELASHGQVLYAARIREIRDWVGRYGFETEFEGFRTLALNHPGNGDLGEHIRTAGYDLAYCYVEVVRQGVLQTVVTLYSDTVDVSELARRYGGGGHRGAAGFQFIRADRPFPPNPVASND